MTTICCLALILIIVFNQMSQNIRIITQCDQQIYKHDQSTYPRLTACIPSSALLLLCNLMYSYICGNVFLIAPSVYVHGTVPKTSGGFILNGFDNCENFKKCDQISQQNTTLVVFRFNTLELMLCFDSYPGIIQSDEVVPFFPSYHKGGQVGRVNSKEHNSKKGPHCCHKPSSKGSRYIHVHRRLK